MTSRTKRRLAVLALALGLIAAAPYVFHFITDRSLGFNFVGPSSMRVFLYSEARANSEDRQVAAGAGIFSIALASRSPKGCAMAYAVRGRISNSVLDLPHESITLRVACAVALAGVWGLVVGGRMLARRWTGTTPQ